MHGCMTWKHEVDAWRKCMARMQAVNTRRGCPTWMHDVDERRGCTTWMHDVDAWYAWHAWRRCMTWMHGCHWLLCFDDPNHDVIPCWKEILKLTNKIIVISVLRLHWVGVPWGASGVDQEARRLRDQSEARRTRSRRVHLRPRNSGFVECIDTCRDHSDQGRHDEWKTDIRLV